MPSAAPEWFLKSRLKTRQLLLLIALDDYRNIHRAADALFMTQPAASKQLKDLEEMLDVKLFERLPRGMEPTLFGESMIRHSRMALGNLSAAQDDITALKSGLAGQVDVGTIITPATGLLPRAIAQVKQQAPLLRIGVRVEQSNVLLERLQRGELDFMIGRILESKDSENLICEALIEEPCLAIARPDHPLLKKQKLQLAEMVDFPWILPPHGSVLRHRFDMMFLRAGLTPPTNVVDATDVVLTTTLLQQTDGLNVIPAALAQYFAALKVVSILPTELPLPCQMDAFGVITRRDRLLSAGANLLLNAVRAEARLLSPQ